jgi:hypothetical protein
MSFEEKSGRRFHVVVVVGDSGGKGYGRKASFSLFTVFPFVEESGYNFFFLGNKLFFVKYLSNFIF